VQVCNWFRSGEDSGENLVGIAAVKASPPGCVEFDDGPPATLDETDIDDYSARERDAAGQSFDELLRAGYFGGAFVDGRIEYDSIVCISDAVRAELSSRQDPSSKNEPGQA